MKAIVTGSEGFIGRHLCCHLEAQGHEVIRIDMKLSLPVCRDMPPADVVYHLAGNPSAPGRRCIGLSNEEMANEISLWFWHENRDAKIVFASTWMAANTAIDYGWSKAYAERTLLRHITPSQLRIVRLCNVYGPGGHGVLDVWRQQIAAGKSVTIHGDGSQRRQFAHVDDVVKVLADPPKSVLTQLEGESLPLAQFALSLHLKMEHAPARDAFTELAYHVAPHRRIEDYLLPSRSKDERV